MRGFWAFRRGILCSENTIILKGKITTYIQCNDIYIAKNIYLFYNGLLLIK